MVGITAKELDGITQRISCLGSRPGPAKDGAMGGFSAGGRKLEKFWAVKAKGTKYFRQSLHF